MSEKNTGKIVTYTYDPLNPPKLTAEERARLDAIRDEDIDLSDIPEQTGLAGWNRPGLFGGPVGRVRLAEMKEKLIAEGELLLVDEDVRKFFEESGGASHHRMNAVLREYVQSHRKSA
jgi:hypothetical protein